jgi:general secretion pathway protein B
MSYILEALKKAEQERAFGRVPGIGSDHGRAAQPATPRWIWALVAVLVVNAVLLVVALWPDGQPQRAAGPAMQASTESQLAAPLPAPPAANIPAARAAPHVTLPVPAQVPLPPPELVPLRPLSQPQAAPTVAEQPVVSPVPATASLRSSTPDPPANLPVWPQVSGALFSQIGSSLNLDVHVYSDAPDERFVLIDMRKYAEGDELQNGLMVDEITPSGVVMVFRDQRFLLQSQ